MSNDRTPSASASVADPHWWQPSQIPVTSEKLLYRSRFEHLWGDLPRLLILGALPGWGKRTWKEQCADYLSRMRPDVKLRWARGVEGLAAALDGTRESTGQVVCFLDGRDAGADQAFWERLVDILADRPWVRCVVGAYGGPLLDSMSPDDSSQELSGEAQSILLNSTGLNEDDLRFDKEELKAICELLGTEGVLNDLFLDGKREMGCPYLVGQHIARMTAPGHVGTWVATDPRIELRLLNLLDKSLMNTRLAQYPIGRVLRDAHRFRAFSIDLITTGSASIDSLDSVTDRLAAVPLFDQEIDDEKQTEQWVWRSDVWRAISEGEPRATRVARLSSGLMDVRQSGRIAAQLSYLLELGQVIEAEELVRRNFRWFLMFCDQWTTDKLEGASIDPDKAPALALLQIELRLRTRGFDPELRSHAERAMRRLRQWTASSSLEAIERGGLLSYGAAAAGHRDEVGRYVTHVLELVHTAEQVVESIDDDARVRAVGACYLAYWAALQTDLHK